MARLQAYRAFDIREVIRSGGSLALDDDRIAIRHGDWQTTVTGDFRIVPTGVVGDLSGISQTVDGKRVFEADLDRSGFTAFDILALRDNDRFFAYVLSGADRLAGSGGHDYLIGFGGNDRLFGGAGADEIFGGSDRDRVWGDAGRDFLAGGDGIDILDGGAGRDRLLGGGGSDTFRFLAAAEAAGDQILDFRAGTDRIDLSALDATTAAGDQAFTFVSHFSRHAGELRAGAGWLAGDLDGDGLSDFRIDLAHDARAGEGDLLL